jgi:hypothetical protein
MEMLCSRLSLESLLGLNSGLSAEGLGEEEQRQSVEEAIFNMEAAQHTSAEAREQAIQEAERAAALARKNAAAQKAAKAKSWSTEEVRMLEKALVRFPQVDLLSTSTM